MTAIKYRMNAGSAGDVNRSHPASIVPHLNDVTNPATRYGQAVMYNGAAQDVRTPASGDNSATDVDVAGFVVRPYPFQPATGGAYGAAGYGTVAPPAGGAVDVLKSGHIMVPCNGSPNLGDPVYIWAAADSGAHLNGYAEAAATGGSTLLLRSAYFASPPDENGLCEINVNMP